MPILLFINCIFVAAIVPKQQLIYLFMNLVFILFASNSNDESRIIRVFSSYDSAYYFKTRLEYLSLLREKLHVSPNENLYIESYELFY